MTTLSSQLVLPLETRSATGREDFIVGPGNEQAVRFIDAYPNWPAPAVALHGPAGSGKSHLVAVWAARAGAPIIEAAELDDKMLARLDAARPVAIENIDRAPPVAAEAALFSLIERAAPLLLTAREPPAAWPVLLPDLASRYRALLAFPLWAPDDALLANIARKLFADRQLAVPDAAIEHMIRALERSPASIHAFVARVDAKALAEQRPVTVALIRKMLGHGEGSTS